ncbi:aliphatic sulfonate ABC transporter substrate-binding protein [Lacticaseibacillus parakribbianus]|uniref:aliphatic sulfonate ABC transporter substrate-binding protein n=1 Tax=Lacticaseibacillus parakribbianus TaxID=2970927 RepID=UPI0021CB3DD9|nr:aliphatic sulfonate ABC transporter substrate-binding protein [Lacticaseibacillus parakribbianus]
MKHKTKVIGLLIALAAWLAVAAYGYTQTDAAKTNLTRVVIGYQKADPVDIARQHGELAKKMKDKGYKVVFKEFQDGAALMTALKSGNIDYARLGDTPPVVNQAAGLDLVYIAAGGSKVKGTAVLVKKNSKIKSMADLKGKRIAYAKGTTAQFMMVQALGSANLTVNDATLVNMDQSAASVAFAKGNVDAWVTWPPYTETAEVEQGAKILIDASGLAKDRDFFVSTRKYAKKHTEVSSLLVSYLASDMKWANANHDKLITMLAKTLHLSKTIVKRMIDRRHFSMGKMTTSIVAEQQKIADVFYEQGLIEKKIKVSDALLK